MEYQSLSQILQKAAGYYADKHNDSGDAYTVALREQYNDAIKVNFAEQQAQLERLPEMILDGMGEDGVFYKTLEGARTVRVQGLSSKKIDWQASDVKQLLSSRNINEDQAGERLANVTGKYQAELSKARLAIQSDHFKEVLAAEKGVYHSSEEGKNLILAKYDLEVAQKAGTQDESLMHALRSDKPIEAFFGGGRMHLGAVNELYVQAVKLAEIEEIELHDAMKQNVLRIGGSEESAHMLADYAVHQKAHSLGDAGAIDAFIDKYTGKGVQAAEKEGGWVKRLMKEPWIGKKGLVFGAATVALCSAAYLGYEALKDKDNGQQPQR